MQPLETKTSAGAGEDSQRTRREERVREALYRGHSLTLANPAYMHTVQALTGELLRQDCERGDLTAEAIGIRSQSCTMEIRAKEGGIAAGVEEAAWFYESEGQSATRVKHDGETIQPGDALIRTQGDAGKLLSLERTAVNLLQRMSGIATATRRLVEIARSASLATHIVATRKTPWGLLDKRAVHLGGGGTHRLNLGDAILIKTNHLSLASNVMKMDLEQALRKAWERRKGAAFIEVEVTSTAEALGAARVFAQLQTNSDSCPCLLLLDNFSDADARNIVSKLTDMKWRDAVIVEASGGISEASVAAYSAAGVDAISVGELTHSARALDLSAKLLSNCEKARA